MGVKFTATLCLLLAIVAGSQFSIHGQIRRSTSSVEKTSQKLATAKIETSGGPKTETKAGRRTKGLPPREISASSATLAVGALIPTEQGDNRIPTTTGGNAQKTAQNYDIGIIPGANGCPLNSELITVYMDDEDDNNDNSASGWIGSFVQNRNTKLRFCRVNGEYFPHLYGVPYAVLQLGACPPQTTSFVRYFDNEDNDNENSASVSAGGSIYPSTMGNAPVSFTQLKFCLFSPVAPGPGTPTFPDLSVEYGVFASSNLPGILAAGTLHIDDEDANNENGYDFGYYSMQGQTGPIISGSYNTDIHIAKVKSGPPLPNLVSVSLNVSSVKGSYNGKDPILTVSIDAPAPPGGQKVFLDTSNNNLAWVMASSWSFTIPAGQTSESFSWFLGTKNVLVNRDVDILATVNGQTGNATLTLKH